MALIEVLHRRATKLGLLPKVIGKLSIVSNILVLISIGLILCLPLDGQYRRTYISENALLPSQAYSYFRESEWNILRGYRTAIEALIDKPARVRNEVISSWLTDFGMKHAVYDNAADGDTLYGVYNSQRGDGTEAIVLAVPWYNTDNEVNIGGAALGISLSRYFSRWPIWSKNIILVISENPHKAMKSWVDAYHNSLDLTGGSLEAAIVLDFPSKSEYFEFVELYFNGINGELPNLDIVNVAISVIEHEGVKVSLQGLNLSEMYTSSYFNRLKTLLFGVKNSALSGTRKLYGNEAFSGRRIQALTLKACGTEGHDITTFGRIPEAIFRSVNNLLEKFHQSFFFYFLVAPRHFVSIGSYLPSAVCLSISFGISAAHSYINNQYITVPLSDNSSILALIIFFGSIAISFIFLQINETFLQPHLMILAFLLISFLPLTNIPQPLITIQPCLSYRLKSFAFIYISLVLTSLLVMNFALAFGMGLLAFPLTFTKSCSEMITFKSKVINCFYLAISNPFIAIFIFVSIFEDDITNFEVFSDLISSFKYMGNWTWAITCIGWFTTWQMVYIANLDTPRSALDGDTKKNL
ncbi:hypothetical protein TPHA_0A01820 [Tetrapisispora phaffii CBS 4417]|uniref:GPI transamidase component GAA1 n=1 Tax=Tetrapisispora phaffii (strain ATCC 24235 / CBS 4417 / NBRC 1672 / NRRL Y-8282 / UCD 70-5) TaxID=1071381 RepID=G8BMY7_TETPH|nr:hypothetical protein TPHA_0A01820 [Tetrapisispora phaffii CBS 4417]CCE61265.1 hypothetical protein TPHA_0A01820 [Tetrapisispora phaffii CBS 4417]